MPTPNVAAMKGEASRLTQGYPKLSEVETIDHGLAENKSEERAQRGLPPPAELVATIAAHLRRERERFERMESVIGERCVRDLIASPTGVLDSSGRGLLGLLLWLIPDKQLDGWIGEAVGRLAYSPGPTAAARREANERLAAARAALVARRRQLVEELAGLGIEIAHLPETEQEIVTENRRRELEAGRLEQQRITEARIAATNAAQPTPRSRQIVLPEPVTKASSAYLAHGKL